MSSTQTPASNPAPETSSPQEVVVLTGATGALGAHILDQLRSSDRILKIHCLVRAASPHAANERVSKSLLARKKAPISPSSPSSKIICHPCKLSDAHLGLNDTPTDGAGCDLYSDLASRTTIIIHAAWAVNFSMRLSSFTKDHIAGLHNLINFALASSSPSPPNFIFCSSTASVTASPSSLNPEKISHDPDTASPLGYSRSKWVAEAICERAHLRTRLRGRIKVLRIGQLCGDERCGIWNRTEAWPLMLSAGAKMGALPNLDESLDWLPVDVAAGAVIQAAFSYSSREASSGKEGAGDIPVYHILNPNKQPTWAEMLRWLPDIQAMPSKGWVNLLERNSQLPAAKLLGLWKDAYNSEETGEKKEVVFELEETKKAVSVMRNVQPIGHDSFLKMWRWIIDDING